jgi:hypothetical protein
VIVDPETTGKTRSAGRILMVAAIGLLAVGYMGLVAFQRSDPDSSARSRERLLAALPIATPSPAVPRATMLGPSVLAQRLPPAALPPLLTLPGDIAEPVALASADARREVSIATSETSRPLVYRLPDGRMFVIQQTRSDRGRPALVNWFEEGLIRGHTAQLYSAPVGPFRALVWWTEGPVTYYLYSGTVAVRELVRITESLR